MPEIRPLKAWKAWVVVNRRGVPLLWTANRDKDECIHEYESEDVKGNTWDELVETYGVTCQKITITPGWEETT